MKKAYIILFWFIALSGLVVCMSFVSSTEGETNCTGVAITIDNNSNFICKDDLDSMLYHKFGKIKGKSMEYINIPQIENAIRNNPFIEDAQVYSTIDGHLNIDVNQRMPLFRVFNSLNQSFYVDDKGSFMPLSDKSTSRVLIVNGNIYDTYHSRILTRINLNDTLTKGKTLMDTIYTLANRIHNDPFFNALIQEIYINQDKEIELIPNIGKQTILIGDISDLDLKFKRLVLFYKNGLNKAGWSTYNYINLKYNNQIVCIKNKEI